MLAISEDEHSKSTQLALMESASGTSCLQGWETATRDAMFQLLVWSFCMRATAFVRLPEIKPRIQNAQQDETRQFGKRTKHTKKKKKPVELWSEGRFRDKRSAPKSQFGKGPTQCAYLDPPSLRECSSCALRGFSLMRKDGGNGAFS